MVTFMASVFKGARGADISTVIWSVRDTHVATVMFYTFLQQQLYRSSNGTSI